MPKDKSLSHARIIPAAKREFLQKGFEKASMRSIAAEAGLTAAGLYCHFKDKEEMFASLVQPALDATQALFKTQTERAYQFLEDNAQNIENIWDGDSDLPQLVNLVYEHFDGFKLLLCCSAGTRFEHFFDEFVQADQDECMRYFKILRQKGVHVNDIVPEEFHLLMNAYYSAFFEIVVHDFQKEDAMHYLETLKKFFYTGWREFLGF